MIKLFADSRWQYSWRDAGGTGLTATLDNPLFCAMSDAMNVAASGGNLPRVQELLQEWDPALNPSQPMSGGGPFSEALRRAVMNGHLSIVVYLLDYGVNCWEEAISEAIKMHSLPMLQAFMEHGWDINEGGPTWLRPALRYGKTPRLFQLLTMIRHLLGDEEIRKWLLSHGADPNIENKHGVTPLETAVAHEDISIVKELLEHGGQPLRDNSLQYAAEIGDNEKIELLLEAGADINMLQYAHKKYAPPRSLQTALHSTVYYHKPESAEFLLKKGANVRVLNDAGKTALQCVEEWGIDGIAELIRNASLEKDSSRSL
jgi:ankyrin repeat protein